MALGWDGLCAVWQAWMVLFLLTWPSLWRAVIQRMLMDGNHPSLSRCAVSFSWMVCSGHHISLRSLSLLRVRNISPSQKKYIYIKRNQVKQSGQATILHTSAHLESKGKSCHQASNQRAAMQKPDTKECPTPTRQQWTAQSWFWRSFSGSSEVRKYAAQPGIGMAA